MKIEDLKELLEDIAKTIAIRDGKIMAAVLIDVAAMDDRNIDDETLAEMFDEKLSRFPPIPDTVLEIPLVKEIITDSRNRALGTLRKVLYGANFLLEKITAGNGSVLSFDEVPDLKDPSVITAPVIE